MSQHRVSGIAVAIFLLTTGALRADNWASFRNGSQQQGVATSELPKTLDVRWEVDDEDGFITSPAIFDGQVYAGALSGTLRCVSLTDGSEIWTASTTADESGFRPGFNSPPTVTEDSVYIGDEDGTFYAFNRNGGSLRWKKQTDDQIAGGATIVGEQILFGSHDGKLYCVSKATGDEKWFFLTDGPVNCSVALAEADGKLRTFVAGCDELLRVIDVESGEEVGSMPLGSPLIASPAIMGQYLYVGTYAGEFSAIGWMTLQKKWTHEGERGQPIHSSAAVTESVVVVGGRDRHLRAFNRETGDVLWEVRTRSKIDSSPVVAGGMVYVGTSDKRVIGVGLASGEVVWEHEAGRPVSVGPAVADGCLVIGTEGPRGKLLCFSANGQ